MIVCVNLNPCVDKTLYLGEIERDVIQTAQRMTVTVGGKANNVARVLSAFGHSATAPSDKVSFGSLSSAVGFVPACVPNPSHASHQPKALLNEKWWGESGWKLRPHSSQAKCWLWTSVRHCGSGTSRPG